MFIEYSNLCDERKIFLNRELADILYLCRKRKISVPEVNFNVISLASKVIIPDHIRNKIRINIPGNKNDCKNFSELCQYEKDIQTSQIISDRDKIWIIAGGEEGAIYGFYETVKRITGIRWYGTSDTDIFFAEKTNEIETIHCPLVALRGFEFSPADEKIDFAGRFLKWMVRNGWNLLDINASKWEKFTAKDYFIKICKLFGIRIALGCHAIDLFVPDSLFSEKPEFFGLRDGKRCLSAEVSSPDIVKKWVAKIQPCYSNLELRKHLVQAVIDFINRHPEIDIFSLWPLDGINNWCQCDECRKQTPYEIFYNLSLEITQNLGRFLPVELLCYSNMFHLPEKVLPYSTNTYTIFCPYLRHYRYRFFDDGFDESSLTLGMRYPEPEPINPTDDREYGVLFSKWFSYLEKIGSQVGLFSYYQLVFHDETERSDRQRYLYHPDPQIVEDEIKKFIDSGIKVFYDCSPPYPGFWPDGRFYAYLPRLLWRDSPSAEKIIREYYKTIAGERAQVLRNILKNISDCLDREETLSSDIIETAKGIFNCLTPEISERYCLWLRYLQMGKESWRAVKNGKIEDAITKEMEIIDFFEKHRTFLQDVVDVDWMIRHSKAIINFYTQR